MMEYSTGWNNVRQQILSKREKYYGIFKEYI